MATDKGFADYVCEQTEGCGGGAVTSRKMFGEYMVYVNGKPIFLVCDNTVYVKINEVTQGLMPDAPKGFPYDGVKEHFILDIDNTPLVREVAFELEKITPLPVKKARNKKSDR